MYKTPQEAIEALIAPHRRLIIAGYIREWQKHRAQGLPSNPEYDDPTTANVTVEPSSDATWHNYFLIFYISGKPAAATAIYLAMARALEAAQDE